MSVIIKMSAEALSLSPTNTAALPPHNAVDQVMFHEAMHAAFREGKQTAEHYVDRLMSIIIPVMVAKVKKEQAIAKLHKYKNAQNADFTSIAYWVLVSSCDRAMMEYMCAQTQYRKIRNTTRQLPKFLLDSWMKTVRDHVSDVSPNMENC